MRARVTAACQFLACAAVLALAGCASDPDSIITASSPRGLVHGSAQVLEPSQPAVWGGDAPPAELAGTQMMAEPAGPYFLDTGDRLRIFVYGQPNLSRAYTVDQEGLITVPLIGDVRARGRSVRDVEQDIRSRLGESYVRDPEVTVDILQNRPFFIYGEVKSGGQFPYISGMTVQTAIAVAGGYTERASERSFRITRRVNGMVDEIVAPADFPLLPGDVVYVNERFF